MTSLIVQGKEARPMISQRIAVMALISGVLTGAAAVDVQARPPNVSDIALCNEQAQAATEREKPGVPDDARGGVLAATPPPGEQATRPRDSRTLSPSPGVQTDSSGSVVTRAPDPLLKGMSTRGLDDKAYRTAYRTCMAARLKSRG
jgi:hypothetical protein